MSTQDSGVERVCHTIYEIGRVERFDTGARLRIFEEHRECLRGLEGFSHAEVLWWFSASDEMELRNIKTVDPPFEAPALGVFASHAPTRPNPVALSTVAIRRIDLDGGVIEIGAIDALDGSPLLDIKPYMPHYSRVESPTVPDWASQWLSSMPEDGVDLDAPPE